VKRARQIRDASLAELEAITLAMPPRYRLMVLLAAWCALRFGELTELRRSEIDLKNAVVRVRRGVVRGDDGRIVKDPKSEAGKRPVNIPPHLMPAVKDHLAGHVAASRTPWCSRPRPVPTWHHRPCTRCTTRPGRRPGGRISDSMTSGTLGPCLPPLPAPRWPS
jgi:integrase